MSALYPRLHWFLFTVFALSSLLLACLLLPSVRSQPVSASLPFAVSPSTSVVRVSDFGASSAVADNSPAFQAALQYAIDHGITSVVVDEPGARYLCSIPAWNVSLPANAALSIDGSGASIVLTNNGSSAQSWTRDMAAISGRMFSNNSLTLHNLTFDMLYPPYAQATYVGSPSPGQYKFALDGSDPPALFRDIWSICGFDSTRAVLTDLINVVNATLQLDAASDSESAIHTYTLTTPSTFSLLPGQAAVLCPPLPDPYPKGVHIYGIDNVVYSSVSLFTAPASGLTSESVDNLVIRDVRVGRRADRLMGTMSDSCPVTSLRGNLTVTGCTFGWGGDDIMNIKQHTMVVMSPVSSSSDPVIGSGRGTITAYVCDRLWEPANQPGHNQFFLRDARGAYVPDSGSFNGLAVYSVLSVGPVVKGRVGYLGDDSYVAVNFTGSAAAMSALPRNASLAHYVFERATNNTVVIEHSHFHTGRSRGIMPDLTFHTTIRNNTFTDLWNGAIGFTAADDGEGPHTSNLLIQGNTFTYGNLPGGVAAFWGYIGLYSAPQFSNDSSEAVSSPDTSPLSPRGMFNLTLADNVMSFYDDIGWDMDNPAHGNAIVVTGATNVTLVNNSIRLMTGRRNKYGVFIRGCDQVTLANNSVTGAATQAGIYIDHDNATSTMDAAAVHETREPARAIRTAES